MDILEKIESKDPKMFASDFNLVDPNNLPKPSMDNLYNNKIFMNWDEEINTPIDKILDCIEDPVQSKEDLFDLDQNNIFREDKFEKYNQIPESSKRRGNFCINNNLYDKYIECDFNNQEKYFHHERIFSQFD